MEASAVGIRLASGVVAPLVKKLFVKEGPGAGLVSGPVRISGLVSFKGEKRTLTDKDLHHVAAELVSRAVRSARPGERPCPEDEETAVADALATTLSGLGDLAMDDVQAVLLGHSALAERLTAAAPHATRGLTRDAELMHHTLLATACLHIVHFFTQRSTFVARTLIQQSRTLDSVITKIDTYLEVHPSQRTADAAFERGYLDYIARKHSRLTIYGIDLAHSPDRWPLDSAYLSLGATSQRRDVVINSTGQVMVPAPASPQRADQALADFARVLLRGVAGSGKSTLIQWLAVSCTKGPTDTPLPHLYGRVPFVLPLRTLTRSGAALPTPDRFLSAVGCPVSGAQPDGWAERVLSCGRGLLLIDGLDEIPERERRAARRWLRDLLDAFPDNLWLVTTRPSAVHEDWLAADGFDELTLTPMGRAEVAAFIGRWHAAARVDAEDVERLDAYEQSLLSAVRTKQDLGRLATNPLMCGLICALHRDRRGYLPHGRKELYDAALSMLLSRRDRERDMGAPTGIELSDEPQVQLLQRLAYWLIRNGRTELARERAEMIIAEALPAVPAAASQGDAAAVFRHLLLRSGLLLEPSPGSVHFIHRTFQDYLGARAAVEEGDFGLLTRYAVDAQFEDVIRMAVAHARPRERAEILRGLIAHGDGIRSDRTRLRVHLLAMACLEHATELDPGVREEVQARARAILPPRSQEESTLLAEVGPIVLELLPGPEELEEDEAREVVATAALIGSDAALEVLKGFRAHPEFNVQYRLASYWQFFDTERYAQEVIRHLGDHAPFTVRSPAELHALKALGGRPVTTVIGPFTDRRLLDELDYRPITQLVLQDNHEISSLAFLREFPALKSLTLQNCPAIDSVVPLADLPFRSLSVSGGESSGVTYPRGLNCLGHLNSLSLQVPLPPEGLAAFPAQAPLTFLALWQPIGTDAAHLASWPRLKYLQLRRLSETFAEEEWHVLTHLTELQEFSFGLDTEGDALRIPPGLQLPQVETLSLLNTDKRPSRELTRILRTALPAFPHIRKLQLFGMTNAPIDLPPVDNLPHLQQLCLYNLRPEIPDSLPPQVKLTLHPRPRT
ncbi:NACHT domain-containing protein [Streptomyces chattanoogensis]|uniref:ATP-binding protein n=1 Tax=Streptomyces chattanoogensis TaxID=66876 RepID=A0A0N0Y1U1_9ACTN|nr:NACHT domain-containing protein [Streptomyces chattanoogensis]KPC65975.1 ATP-binding protein [Streptomyces chattanoogensis]